MCDQSSVYPTLPTYVSVLLHLKFGGFGIGYSIGRKYRQITISVSVSDQDQNSDFGRSLSYILLICFITDRKETNLPKLRSYCSIIYTVTSGYTITYCGGILVSRLEGTIVLDYELHFRQISPQVTRLSAF